MKDRAKAHVHIVPYEGNYKDFAFDEDEVLGVCFVDAQETLQLFKGELKSIKARIISLENGKFIDETRDVTIDDFLVMKGENQLEKYGDVLKKVIEATTYESTEFLDYYDEDGNYLGYAPRDIVHRDGLWHKTVQNWFYTDDGKCLFQIRKDSGKLYTSSSGHVDKGETLEEALKRETMEELGIEADVEHAKVIDLVTWKMDKVKSNGFAMKDRAKSTFFLVPYNGDFEDFHFDPDEVLGAVFVDAKETLAMFEKNRGSIEALVVRLEGDKLIRSTEKVSCDDFLLLKDENLRAKYGKVLNSIIEETKK